MDTNTKKFIIGVGAIAAGIVAYRVYTDKTNATTTKKIKKVVGLADGAQCCGLADADGAIIAETKEVNAALKKVGAPFYSLCGRKGLTFRKHGESCNDEENIYYVQRKTVDNWLKKHKDTSLTELVKTSGKSAANVEKIEPKPEAKAEKPKKQKREIGKEMYGPTSRPREYGKEFYGPYDFVGPKYQESKKETKADAESDKEDAIAKQLLAIQEFMMSRAKK